MNSQSSEAIQHDDDDVKAPLIIPPKLEEKMRILANFLIDRILEDIKNDKIMTTSKEIKI